MSGTDIHVHLAPLLDTTASASLLGVEVGTDGRIAVDGHLVGLPKLYDVAALAAYVESARLDRAVVSLPPPFYRQQLSIDDARHWVRAVNDGVLARIAETPSLSALGYLPLEHPELALEEYERLRADGRFVGMTAAAGGASVLCSDPRLEPLWARLDEDAALLLLHPGTAPDARLDPFYLSNLLGNPSETAVSVAHLVLGGVLSRFPRMKVVLVHCGGTVPALVGRWDRGVATRRPGLDEISERPSDAVRRLYVDCLAHDSAVVDLAASVFGEDRILLGSDWPFPMGTEDPLALIQHRGPGFARQVAVENARRLLTVREGASAH